jgi:excisionase family DNA binding protein
MPPVAPSRLLTVQEFAERLAVSTDTVHWLIARGKLHAVQPGGPRTRVPRTARQVAEAVVSERLPELLDAKALRLELGVSRAAAEAIMRRLPVVSIEGLRKTYVRRSDVAAYLKARTFAKEQVPV